MRTSVKMNWKIFILWYLLMRLRTTFTPYTAMNTPLFYNGSLPNTLFFLLKLFHYNSTTNKSKEKIFYGCLVKQILLFTIKTNKYSGYYFS